MLNYGSTIIERKAGFNHEFYEKDKVNYYVGNIMVEENINGIKETMSIVHESSYENLVQTKKRRPTAYDPEGIGPGRREGAGQQKGR